jgi:phosphoglycolate phosphatase-like HAD superfamily hydrolase
MSDSSARLDPRLRAVVLDFDGVVLDSVDLKTGAFAAVFAGEPADARARIMEYHGAHNGISRYEKFRWAYREVLRRPLPPEEEAALGARYNRLVEDAVVAAAEIPGALDFVRACPLPVFVASGTPEEELRRVVARRGWEALFAGVRGAPARKAPILRGIADSLGAGPGALVMVGDAMTDHDAARDAGARFLGVVAPGLPDPFPRGTETLPDLTGLAARLAARDC